MLNMFYAMLQIIQASIQLERSIDHRAIIRDDLIKTLENALKEAKAFDLLNQKMEKEYRESIVPSLAGILTNEKLIKIFTSELLLNFVAYTPGESILEERTYQEYASYLKDMPLFKDYEIKTFYLFKNKVVLKKLEDAIVVWKNLSAHSSANFHFYNPIPEMINKRNELFTLFKSFENLKYQIKFLEELLSYSNEILRKRLDLQKKIIYEKIGESLRNLLLNSLNHISNFTFYQQFHRNEDFIIPESYDINMQTESIKYYLTEFKMAYFKITNQKILDENERKDLNYAYENEIWSTTEFSIHDRSLGRLFIKYYFDPDIFEKIEELNALNNGEHLVFSDNESCDPNKIFQLFINTIKNFEQDSRKGNSLSSSENGSENEEYFPAETGSNSE